MLLNTKDIIDDVKIKFIQMPDKLECVYIDDTLYINNTLSSNLKICESTLKYLPQQFNLIKHIHSISKLIPLKDIVLAIHELRCTSLKKLSEHFNLSIPQIYLTLYFYQFKYPNIKLLDFITEN